MDQVSDVTPDDVSPDVNTGAAAGSLAPARRRFAISRLGRRTSAALPADPTGSRARRLPKRPASSLAEHWTRVDGVDVFYRESPHPPTDTPAMMHLHGFGLSGRYLLPTAERLAGDFHTLVPDLPGFGRSGKPLRPLDVPDLAHAAARFLDDRQLPSATLVGNSMGCPVICEFAHHYPDRIDRAVLVSPAGGLHNQPFHRAADRSPMTASGSPPG